MPGLEIAQQLDSCERTEDVIVNEDVSFESLTLSEKTLKGLNICGFKKPSPIQLRAVPLGRCGFDLIIEAKSGTGKTAVFGIISLEMISIEAGLQVLIIAPTREIAAQIGQVLKSIGSFYGGLVVETVMGGVPIDKDIKRLNSKNYQILVGSPGRIYHLIKKNTIQTKSIRLFVLDEADKLMEKSFMKDINKIFLNLPDAKQVIATSATYTDVLRNFLSRYMVNHMHVQPYTSSVLLGLTQCYVIVPTHQIAIRQNMIKFNKMLEVISQVPFKQCLIFCKYQSRAQMVCEMLCQGGWPSEYLAASQNQDQRLNSLEKLQTFSCRILVATDLASRGIDASNVNLVINIDPPDDCATYLHRIGRAGRYGSKALAIAILSDNEKVKLDNILKPLNDIKMTPFELNTLVENNTTEVIENKIVKIDENNIKEPLEIDCNSSEKNSENIDVYLLHLMNNLEKSNVKIDNFEAIVEKCKHLSNDSSISLDSELNENKNLLKYLSKTYKSLLIRKTDQLNSKPEDRDPILLEKVAVQDLPSQMVDEENSQEVTNSKTSINEVKVNKNKINAKAHKSINQNGISQSHGSRRKSVNKESNKHAYEDENFSHLMEEYSNIDHDLLFNHYNNWRQQLNVITTQIQQAVYIETLTRHN